jgi:hypothetical protein
VFRGATQLAAARASLSVALLQTGVYVLPLLLLLLPGPLQAPPPSL